MSVPLDLPARHAIDVRVAGRVRTVRCAVRILSDRTAMSAPTSGPETLAISVLKTLRARHAISVQMPGQVRPVRYVHRSLGGLTAMNVMSALRVRIATAALDGSPDRNVTNALMGTLGPAAVYSSSKT